MSGPGRAAILALVASGLAACSQGGSPGDALLNPDGPPCGGDPRHQLAGIGQGLTDGDGYALYMFPPDAGRGVTCTGACAGTWPSLRGQPRRPRYCRPRRRGAGHRAYSGPDDRRRCGDLPRLPPLPVRRRPQAASGQRSGAVPQRRSLVRAEPLQHQSRLIRRIRHERANTSAGSCRDGGRSAAGALPWRTEPTPAPEQAGVAEVPESPSRGGRDWQASRWRPRSPQRRRRPGPGRDAHE